MRDLARITDGLIGQPMFKLLTKVRNMERSGQKVYHFEIGDSDYPAYSHIVEATKRALDQDKTHYVESSGIAELKEAIRDHTVKTHGFRPDGDQILVMPSNAIIDCAFRCVVDPGYEVLYPDPGFSTYIAVTNYTGIQRVGYPLLEKNDFRLHVSDIATRINTKTRLVVLNSPNNPTGSVATQEEIMRLADLVQQEDLYLLSDEIYSQVLYDDATHFSPAVYDQCQERTIILNGFAKNYSMPGWRLGYAIGPKAVIEKMGVLFQTMYSCLPAFVQYGGIAALTGDQKCVNERIYHYETLRDLIVDKLNSLPGVSCVPPQGACYVFPNITGTGMSCEEFADFALEQAQVALLPGTCFGPYGEGHVRLCFTRSVDTIELSMEKLRVALTRQFKRSDYEVFVG